MKMTRTLTLAAMALACVSANAIVFSNVDVQSPPLNNGWSFNTNANSITFFTPNACVGDNLGTRAGTVNMYYDADNGNGPAMMADDVTVNLQTLALGSGTIYFREMVFEIDAFGSEIGGPIGQISQVFNSSSSMTWSDTIWFSRTVNRLRAKKSFTLVAPDTQALDLACIGIVNQSIQTVPEPGTIAALGLGAVVLLRRKRR